MNYQAKEIGMVQAWYADDAATGGKVLATPYLVGLSDGEGTTGWLLSEPGQIKTNGTHLFQEKFMQQKTQEWVS